MSRKKNQNQANTRKPLASAEHNYLWMVSAGLCSFKDSKGKPCRKRLIIETDGHLTNKGIIAHIVGHKQGAARHEFASEFGFTPDNLEIPENLTLMCYEHSKLIDDKHARDSYPAQLLFDMKKEHEKWVSSWSEENRKKSIALIHKRLGPPTTSIDFDGEAPYIMLEAVEDQTEFTDFTPEGWQKAKKQNEGLYQRFIERLKVNDAKVAEIFPISPIPLLLHIGYLITDTVPLSVYQFDREKQIWVAESPDGIVGNDFGLDYNIIKQGANELAITVSVSGQVRDIDVIAALSETKYDQFNVWINEPGLKRVLYKEQIQSIQRLVKDKTETLLQESEYSKIHLFYAGPAGLAAEIGRGVNARIWPEVCLYQYSVKQAPRYQYAISLT